jgi:hypothetical protein
MSLYNRRATPASIPAGSAVFFSATVFWAMNLPLRATD